MKDEITLLGMFPECQSKKCTLRKECANHCTAGDFRMEDGGTPDLTKDIHGYWECTESFSIEYVGALVLSPNGTLRLISPFEELV